MAANRFVMSSHLRTLTTDFERTYAQWLRQELTQAQAAAALNISERTFRRRIVRYRKAGPKGLQDRRGASHDRAPSSEIAALEDLYATNHRNWSVLAFFREYQRAHDGTRSYSWVKKHLQRAGLVPIRTRKGAQSVVEGRMLHQWVWRYQWVGDKECDLVVTAGRCNWQCILWLSCRSTHDLVELFKGFVRL